MVDGGWWMVCGGWDVFEGHRDQRRDGKAAHGLEEAEWTEEQDGKNDHLGEGKM